MSTIIGQSKFLERVYTLQNNFPTFVILEGAKGQGKKTVAKELSKILGYRMLTIGTKIDDIREMIANTGSLSVPTIYFIPDADNMSVGAKNSLLKITEEPPKNLYIVLTLQHRENTLSTIRSRATVLELDNYTRNQLEEYLIMNYPVMEPDLKDELLDYVDNPGEIDDLMSIGIQEFLDYVYKVFDNILEVSTGNSFKIPNQFKFKEDDKGYPVQIFLKIFERVCISAIDPRQFPDVTLEQIETIAEMIRITNKALNELNTRGINKKSVIDLWILDIRRLR